jgi:hypothetical protein
MGYAQRERRMKMGVGGRQVFSTSKRIELRLKLLAGF